MSFFLFLCERAGFLGGVLGVPLEGFGFGWFGFSWCRFHGSFRYRIVLQDANRIRVLIGVFYKIPQKPICGHKTGLQFIDEYK